MEGTDKVVVEIDLGPLVVDGGETFAHYVASVAARELMRGEGTREATGEYRRRALSIADEEIREQLQPIIADALEGAVQRTGPFGEPRGETQTLREVIVQAALDQLRKPQGDGFGGTRRGETLVQFVIRKEVEEALGRDLKAVVAGAREEVLAAVSGKAADVIAETIAKVAEGRRP